MKYFDIKFYSLLLPILLLGNSSNAAAAVVYDFFYFGSSSVTGYISFKDSVASSSSGWSIAAGSSLVDQLEGGLSGIVGAFSYGFESAISGDLTVATNAGSLNGKELDFGTFGSGVFTFSDGSTVSAFSFGTFPIDDTVTVDFAFDGLGNPIIGTGRVSIVPVPTAFWLFSSGLIGLIGLARHKA